jgi:type I restriction enzyme M protein
MNKHSSRPSIPPLNHVIEYLRALGFEHVSGEVIVRSGSRSFQADAVAYDNSPSPEPLIVVELKNNLPDRPTFLDTSVQQAFTIATLLGPSVRYLLITNGTRHSWFERHPASQSLTPLESAPTAGDSVGFARAEAMGLVPIAGLDDLTRLIQELIGVLLKENVVFGVPMAIEVNRILIAKLVDERSTFAGGTSHFRLQRRETETAERLRELYYGAIAPFAGVHALREHWTTSAGALSRAVAILEQYYLGATPAEILGEWFWRLLPPLLPRNQAQYFTPAPIGRVMAELAGISASDRVADPACGAGLLLLEANRLIRNVDPAGTSWFQQQITGIELNAEVAEFAATNLILAGLNPTRIIHGDALAHGALATAGVRDGTYDVVLLDPPLGRVAPDKGPYRNLELARHPSIGLEALFLERALTLLRPGGRLAVLVPDGLLSSPAHLPARRWLVDNTVFRAIISLPPEAFAPVGHAGKASILLLEKNSKTAGDERIFVADVTSVGYDRFGNPVPENDLPGVTAAYVRFRDTGQLPSEGSLARVWATPLASLSAERLDVLHLDPEVHDTTHLMRHGSHPTATLKEVSEILSGSGFKDYVEPSADAPRVIQAGMVREFHLDLAAAPCISPEQYARSARSRVRQGDVLVTTTGLYLGRASVVEDLEFPAVVSGAVTILRSRSGLDPHFLAAFLNSRLGRQQVASRQASAVAQPYIRRSDLAQILVPLPPLGVQRELGQRAHAMHREALRLRAQAEAIEGQARDLVAAELLESRQDD